ncbi:hypothetical protein DMI80_09860 [Akkermansia muciniphila]|nr:hypothetical protein DMI78_09850 [Akkermansia muciniphila]QHV68614.1 hypothetical protein DMI79_09890 [Akkermansia muciniphila]QHV71092.1 hypothetical protein DMI80_09860 [Akkermansia muciniphila]QHV73547.1 hypothetical protein DMI81_09860 [Akkermansia muciniphila]
MKKVLKFIGECLGAAAFGALGGWVYWLVVSQDDTELKAGKSPHSGFCPESPTPMKAFDGFEKPSRSPRTGESNNQ